MREPGVAVVGRQPKRPRRRNVTCDCGAEREVSYENARRIERGLQSRKCGDCLRGMPPTRLVSEAHLLYWLMDVAYVPAASMPDGPRAYVREHGLPPEVALIASGIPFWPDTL